MHLDFLNQLLLQYGVYAVLILVMVEGDITLLIAGVLAHSGFFGDYSFAQVLIWGTIGGCASDNVAYFAGRAFCEGVRELRFYRAAKPRLERLTNKFGPLSIFLSKYIYGLRWASCVFYGVGRDITDRVVANAEMEALRRIATLTAEGANPERLFGVVAEEVRRVIGVPLVSVARFEGDGTATECASYSPAGPAFPSLH